MSALAEKMRRARETKVTVAGHSFTVRRPSQLEIVEVQAESGGLNLRNSLRFIVGWEMTELTLGLPGGTGAAVEFDPEAFVEWVSDHPDAWAELMGAVMTSYREHADKVEADAKNS
jgi:hypothetical protein